MFYDRLLMRRNSALRDDISSHLQICRDSWSSRQPLVQEFGGQWLKEMKDECIKVLETVKDKPLGMEVGELKTDKLWDAVRDHPPFRAIVD